MESNYTLTIDKLNIKLNLSIKVSKEVHEKIKESSQIKTLEKARSFLAELQDIHLVTADKRRVTEKNYKTVLSLIKLFLETLTVTENNGEISFEFPGKNQKCQLKQKPMKISKWRKL